MTAGTRSAEQQVEPVRERDDALADARDGFAGPRGVAGDDQPDRGVVGVAERLDRLDGRRSLAQPVVAGRPGPRPWASVMLVARVLRP